MTKLRRTIEKPAGRGHIRLPDGNAVNVRYHLVVVQTIDDEADTRELPRQLEIRGAVEVEQGWDMIDLAGKNFTLKMNDGRCLEAKSQKGDPVTRQWEIVATAPNKGLEPC